ncbi:hypothetical protein [Neolewinella persica]|uniref:hypothetical protein n=1 Tax=Neolewinella persica TaxID=70998 RepID=UPI000361BE30|nr:hypothetical protein [Neolewinella persica]
MPSRQPPQHKDSDAAGRARYADFESSRDRVRRQLAAAHPVVSTSRRRRQRWVYAAASLLLLCFFGWYFLQPPAYAQLADDYRTRIATDELSTTRAVNQPTQESLEATALSLYHQGEYTQAAAAFSSLSQEEDQPKQEIFVFYQGVSQWLGRDPAAAIETLAPLQQLTPVTDLRYRTISYVLAMAYIDNEELSSGSSLLKKIAEKDDGLGERAASMLKVLP